MITYESRVSGVQPDHIRRGIPEMDLPAQRQGMFLGSQLRVRGPRTLVELAWGVSDPPPMSLREGPRFWISFLRPSTLFDMAQKLIVLVV